MTSPSTRSLQAFRQRRAARRAAPQADYLVPVDQASFLMSRASGRAQVMQCIWIYEHPVDLDAVRKFQQFFGHSLAGRRIEPSPLPFGRHRWVAAPPPPAELDIAEPRPRSEFSDWLDERAQIPVDPELGPGWHLGVLPMTDGSTGIALVGSHCLGDGTAAVLSTIEAIMGQGRDLGYQPLGSRSRPKALAADARQTIRDLPLVGRTLVNAVRTLYRSRHDLLGSAKSSVSGPVPTSDTSIVVIPAITVQIDLDAWDAKATELGGNGYALLAGFGAQLGERMGRRHSDDGGVTLLIAISDRTLEDTRAHAMEFVNVNVDASQVTTDLSDARVVIRQAIKKLREEPDESFELLPLIPFIPKRAVQKLGDVIFGFDELPVSCSNLGDIFPVLAQLDGTDAEYMALRGVDQNVTRRDLERAGGQLVVVAARINGRITISIVGYQVGAENTKPRLRQLAADTLAEFGLTGEIV